MSHVEVVGLFRNLGLATAMVALTVMMHFWGLIFLLRLMNHTGRRLRAQESSHGQALLLVLVVFGIFGLHTAEIWLYSALYLWLGALNAVEPALYYSTVSFVSLGYGDLTLPEKWRLLGAIEAANGVILVAWSAGFLHTVTTRLRALEHDWLKPHDETS
ncbi:MAG: ion channel [Caulobacter sp.]|jgi:protein-S-isoprenylcysteine O-methyltransferase Ste14|nr:ion channel [Caulobacter sp.]